MSLRFIVGLCAIIVGAFSVTICQPPTPRISKGEGPAQAAVASGVTTVQGILVAFDLTGLALQIRNLDGQLTNSSKRSR